MGEPVLRTRHPRTTPSVASIAMVRTTPSPKCWATSNTSLEEWSRTSSAVRIGGKPSSNLTSTTAPITWQTCPIAPFPVNSSVIFPPPPTSFFAGGAEGGAAAAAAAVAYSATRLSKNPCGEARLEEESLDADAEIEGLDWDLRREDRSRDETSLREAIFGEREWEKERGGREEG